MLLIEKPGLRKFQGEGEIGNVLVFGGILRGNLLAAVVVVLFSALNAHPDRFRLRALSVTV